jgi:hypothetical protein
VLNSNEAQTSNSKRQRPQSRLESSLVQLSQTIEERAIKTAGAHHHRGNGRPHRFRAQSVREHSLERAGTPDDYSSVIERTDRMKQRWMRIIENKERLQYEQQRSLRLKMDKMSKQDKSKRKRAEGDKEDRKMLGDMKVEKQATVFKRREQMQNEFDRELRTKEEQYKKRITAMLDSKNRTPTKQIVTIGDKENKLLSGSKIGSELGEALANQPKERARTAMSKHARVNSSHHESVSQYFDDEEDEEELVRKLEDYEKMLQRAEIMRRFRLVENIERVHQNNEKIALKQAYKSQRQQETEYQRLRDMVEHQMAIKKKAKQRE